MKSLTYILTILWISVLVSTIGFGSAYESHKKNTDLEYSFTSNNATQCNLTTGNTPNGVTTINQIATKNGQTFNVSILAGNFTSLGTYCYNIICTDGSQIEPGSFCRDVNLNGEDTSGNQGYMILGQLGIIALLLVISFSFDKAKWKLRSFFHMAALLMGIITLNSIRLISGSSTSLNSMGDIGLILGIIILAFMFLFILINYTIELFRYFKKKNINKFEVEEQV